MKIKWDKDKQEFRVEGSIDWTLIGVKVGFWFYMGNKMAEWLYKWIDSP